MDGSAFRRSARLRDGLDISSFESRFPVCAKQCGACLLEITSVGFSPGEEVAATLDSCRPLHIFHAGCIFMWMQQENSCPQCKQRFSRVALYNASGVLQRVTRALFADQDFSAPSRGTSSGDLADSEVSASDAEDAACEVCNKTTDEASLLLCDGRAGECSGACHFYCAGLARIPEGDWFCARCRATTDRVSAVKREPEEVASGAQAASGTLGVTAALPPSTAPTRAVRTRQSASPHPHPQKAKPELKPKTNRREQHCRDGKEEALKWESPRPSPPATTAKRKSVDVAPKLQRSRSAGGGAVFKRAGPEVFGGLCREMPTWISRQASMIRIDLGGRGIRDPAAAVLAQVITAALEHALQRGDSGLTDDTGACPLACVVLARNRLHKPGVMAILESIVRAGVRVEHLDLERNRLDGAAAKWLGEWCARQRHNAPKKLCLSYNKICDVGAASLLSAVGQCPGSEVVSGGLDCHSPRWIELSHNRISDVTFLLEQVSLDVTVCLALDSAACTQTSCACSDKRASLHLPGILDQGGGAQESGEEMPPDAKRPRVKLESADDVSTSFGPPSSEPIQTDRNQVVLSESERQTHRELAASRAEERMQSARLRGIGNAEHLQRLESRAKERDGRRPSVLPTDESTNSAVGFTGSSVSSSSTAPFRLLAPVVPRDIGDCSLQASSSRDGVGGSGGEGGLRESSQPTLVTGVEPVVVSERTLWAQSLGQKVSKGEPAYEYCQLDDPPPGYSIWDFMRRPLTKKEKLAKRRKAEADKKIALGNLAAAKGDEDQRLFEVARREGPIPIDGDPLSSAATIGSNVEGGERASARMDVQPLAGCLVGPGVATSRAALHAAHVRLQLEAGQAIAERQPLMASATNGGDALRRFVSERLDGYGSGLWSKWEPGEQSLRRRLIRDRLSRQAVSKYGEIVKGRGGSWQAYLASEAGRHRIGSWVDKKVAEMIENKP